MQALNDAVLRGAKEPPDDHGIQWVNIRLPIDQAKTLLRGLMRADAGAKDPFEFEIKGRPPALSWREETYAVELFEYLRGQKGMTYEEAIEAVAQRMDVSERTVASAIKDNPEMQAFARHLYAPRKK
jgi:hypothetical protein